MPIIMACCVERLKQNFVFPCTNLWSKWRWSVKKKTNFQLQAISHLKRGLFDLGYTYNLHCKSKFMKSIHSCYHHHLGGFGIKLNHFQLCSSFQEKQNSALSTEIFNNTFNSSWQPILNPGLVWPNQFASHPFHHHECNEIFFKY